MNRATKLLVCVLTYATAVGAPPASMPTTQTVGPVADGGHIVPTSQLIRPAGKTLEVAGRPVCVAVAPDGRTVYAKDNRGLIVVDAREWTLRQELPFEKAGGTMAGIAVSSDGARVYATTTANALVEALIGADGKLEWKRSIALPGPVGKDASFPCGVAIARDGRTALVCLSRNNTLAQVDLETGELRGQIAVGVAPTAVAFSIDEKLALVTNWGGRRAREGDRTAESAGTQAVVDERGVAASGTVSIVDPAAGQVVAELEVGLSPVSVAVHPGGTVAYVACANTDTVALIDIAARRVVASLAVQPIADLPIGSMPNGLGVTTDGAALFVSLAGNNAVCVVALADGGTRFDRIRGYIPAGWYPGGLAVHGQRLYVANIKGVGSRTRRETKGWNSHWHRGSLTCVELPDDAALGRCSEQVRNDARLPEALRSLERGRSGVAPTPVPANAGEPSVFEHVLYVIKENRTYDQVFGDLPQGNGDPNLCIYGRTTTPNHHALAEEFVLLDNFYCNGVLSADGHSWATEGNVAPYLERSFGGFGRSYTFGDDPLTYSASGFIWDRVLAVPGLSFRNYGEFDYAETIPASDYATVYRDFTEQTGRIKRTQKIGVERVRRYSCPEYPGWNMEIPDVLRADVFLREFRQFEADGKLPNFIVVYLPNDHTSGAAAGKPRPRALVADNDLALGRIVEAVSKSRYWAKTCIFVIEDDPQDGFDHVDGHRSLCLVASPHTKRGAVVSNFYNQTSVVHTMERILGCTATNQLYALAPLMTECFTGKADLRPFECRPAGVPLAELNPPAEAMTPAQQQWASKSAALPLQLPDAADEDTLNRILWHDAKGAETPYPAHMAGAHGAGLKALGLRLVPGGVESDDDD